MDLDHPTTPVIKASELAEFDYCRRAWWLRHVRLVTPPPVTPAIRRGQTHHTSHYGQVHATILWQRVAYLLLGVGGVVISMAVCLGLA
jgi:hypothetical protein